MNSRVLSFFAKIPSFFAKLPSIFVAVLAKINICYEESVCCKVFNKVWAVLADAFKGSFIYRFFSREKHTGVWENSIFGRIVNSPKVFLLFLQRKLSPWLCSHIESSKVCSAFSKWDTVSVRIYGLTLLIFGILTTFLRDNSKNGLALLIVTEVLGLILILVNRSINQMVGSSKIAMFLGRIFTDCQFRTTGVSYVKKQHYIIAGVVGAVMSAICVYASFDIMVVVVGAVLALAFFMKYTTLGVFLTVALSPVLPTMVLVGLSFVCAFVFLIRIITDKNFEFVKTPFNVAVVFFVISLLWGVVNSQAMTDSFKQVLVHGSFILFYIVVTNIIRTKEQWILLIKVFMFSALVVAVYGIIQNFVGMASTESWLDEKMFNSIGRRVYSFFNNPNVLGEFLVLTIPTSVAFLWYKAKKERKTLYIITTLCMVLCMIFTWSRGAWLGMILALVLFLTMHDKRWMAAGIACVLVMPIILYITGNAAIVERFMSIGNTADTSTAYRVSIWKAATNMIADNGLLGIGIGTSAFEKVYPAYALSGADFALHSHNLYLQYMVETGIAGIVALFALLLGYMKTTLSVKVVRQIKKTDTAKILVALGTGFIGFLFQGLTDYVWYNYKMLMIFWIIIALGVCGAKILESENKGGDSL